MAWSMLPGEGDDAMTVNWTLRPGLKWSDGEALTCDDFKFAWDWVLDENNFGVVTAGFEDIRDIDCRSDTEMIWHFQSVYEGYLTLMTAPLPRHYLEAIPMDQQTQGVGFRPDEVPKLPVTGPFRFESVTPATEIRMVKNPNYTSPRTTVPAHLDSLTFRWHADSAALIAAYRAGTVDRRSRPRGRGPREGRRPGRRGFDTSVADVRDASTELVGGHLFDQPCGDRARPWLSDG